MRKKAVKAGKIFLIFIGVFMIVMATDVFQLEGSILQRFGGFIITSLPGVSLIYFVKYFWKNELYIGVTTIIINTIFLFVFQFLTHLPESLFIIFLMIVPLYIIGILFIIESKQKIT